MALLVAALALAPGAAGAASLATATVYAGGVDFLPHVAHAGATVSVSGQGLSFERSFAAGVAPSIGVFDPDGQLLPDGVYTWRLELTPSRAAARELRRAARRNGGAAPEPWEAMSGAFAIRNGLVADPNRGERRPARQRPAALSPALPTDLAAAAAGRIADDDDAATAAGRGPLADDDAITAETGRPNPRGDAATLAAGPAPAARAAKEQPTRRRSWQTDGKNGRDQ